MNGQGQRKQKGKYYTPQAVVDLCWEVLRAKIAPATLRSFQVVDPAAGDGVFLQEACARGWITGQLATGVELYPGEASRAGVLFRVVKGNGLIDRPEEDFVAGRFDLAVGNPPYGGEGLRDLCRSWEKPAARAMLRQLFYRYDLCRFYLGLDLPEQQEFNSWLRGAAGQRALAKLGRCPIELFFLERFICLCREGAGARWSCPRGCWPMNGCGPCGNGWRSGPPSRRWWPWTARPSNGRGQRPGPPWSFCGGNPARWRRTTKRSTLLPPHMRSRPWRPPNTWPGWAGNLAGERSLSPGGGWSGPRWPGTVGTRVFGIPAFGRFFASLTKRPGLAILSPC